LQGATEGKVFSWGKSSAILIIPKRERECLKRRGNEERKGFPARTFKRKRREKTWAFLRKKEKGTSTGGEKKRLPSN